MLKSLLNIFDKSKRKTEEEINSIFIENGFNMGRLISHSKSGYYSNHPDNLIVFNANIITKTYGKIWHGDLDVTLDEIKLKEVSKQLGETIYVLREHDCRFDNENKSFKEYKKIAVWHS